MFELATNYLLKEICSRDVDFNSPTVGFPKPSNEQNSRLGFPVCKCMVSLDSRRKYKQHDAQRSVLSGEGEFAYRGRHLLLVTSALKL